MSHNNYLTIYIIEEKNAHIQTSNTHTHKIVRIKNDGTTMKKIALLPLRLNQNIFLNCGILGVEQSRRRE